MEEAGKHVSIFSTHTYPLHVLRNVLKQRKDAKAVLDPVPPAAVSIPPKIPVTAPAPKTRNPPSNEKSLISNGHRKTNQIDLLRKHEHLFPRVSLVFTCLELTLTLRSS